MPSVSLSEITIGHRYREDATKIESLAESMKAIGQLHPITLTSSYELIAGQKRCLAARSLGWTEIDARIVDAEIGSAEALQIEQDENEEREPFRASEKVAIAKAHRAKLGLKQGARTDIAPNGAKLQGRTDEHVARAVGFTSEQALRRAEKVVDHAAPEIIKAMDNGDVSIADAAAVADLPKAEQVKALKKKKAGKTRTLKAGTETREQRLERIAKEQKNGSETGNRANLKRQTADALGKVIRGFHSLGIYDAHRPELNKLSEVLRKA